MVIYATSFASVCFSGVSFRRKEHNFLTTSSLKYINIEVFRSKLYRLSISRNVYRELKLVN